MHTDGGLPLPCSWRLGGSRQGGAAQDPPSAPHHPLFAFSTRQSPAYTRWLAHCALRTLLHRLVESDGELNRVLQAGTRKVGQAAKAGKKAVAKVAPPALTRKIKLGTKRLAPGTKQVLPCPPPSRNALALAGDNGTGRIPSVALPGLAATCTAAPAARRLLPPLCAILIHAASTFPQHCKLSCLQDCTNSSVCRGHKPRCDACAPGSCHLEQPPVATGARRRWSCRAALPSLARRRSWR